jgi:hypothetical protein
MEDQTINKVKAAAKITYGVGKGVGAVMLATGHGFLGGILRSHHMMGAAAKLARDNFKAAGDTINEGLDDWNNA